MTRVLTSRDVYLTCIEGAGDHFAEVGIEMEIGYMAPTDRKSVV